jgi:hypothetical protein
MLMSNLSLDHDETAAPPTPVAEHTPTQAAFDGAQEGDAAQPSYRGRGRGRGRGFYRGRGRGRGNYSNATPVGDELGT